MLSLGARRLRVAVVCSRRAPGLDHLLRRDPSRGRSWELVGVATSDPACVERGRLAEAGVPAVLHDIRAFYAERDARLADLGPRRDYDRATVRVLERFGPDLVVLCGYLHIATEPLFEAYPERVLNIHDGELPRYPGLHATRDAVCAGERETRSTVHLAVAAVDAGPVLLTSWPFPTHPLIEAARGWDAADILKAYAYAQREWMMRAAWGPLLAAAIDAYARGAVSLRDGRAFLAGTPAPRELVAEPPRPLVRAAGARRALGA